MQGMPQSIQFLQRSLLLALTPICGICKGTALHTNYKLTKQSIIMATEITIFEPQNFGVIVQSAPQAYSENKVSHTRCLQFGQQLLDRVNTEGMSDALDQEIAVFIDRAKKTVKKMNGKRSGVTQIFDTIRSAYTALENEVDPAKKGTIPAQLQEERNRYAAKKREEAEAKRRAEAMRLAQEQARAKYAADVEADLLRQYDALAASACNRLIELDKSLTLENYAIVADGVKNFAETLPEDWYENLRAEVLLPTVLPVDEAHKIAADVKQRLHQRFVEQYTFEVSGTRQDILDRLPSKRKELERIAKANAEEAARIKAQMEERERKEAEQRAKEKAEREAQEKAAAELAAKKQEMDGLFGAAQAEIQTYQPKTQVRKRINVLNPEGFMQVVGMWWSQCGCTMTVAELEKEFKKQLTFCSKLANDKEHPIFIQSEHIEYVDDVKAK